METARRVRAELGEAAVLRVSTYPRERESEEGARECSGAYRRRGKEPLEMTEA